VTVRGGGWTPLPRQACRQPAQANRLGTGRTPPAGSPSEAAQSEAPHPTAGAVVAPADAGFIRLLVPDRFADVTFNGQSVSNVCKTRDYLTPALQPGQTYRYTITVAWGQGDQQKTVQRTIDIARGQTSG
jgi:uncharacterized protein (TIGR03000 family)